MGRPQGSKNKASAAFKAWCVAICDDPAVQAKAKEQILDGRIDLFFKAAEHAFGRPQQSMAVTGSVDGTLVLGSDVAED